MSELRPYLATVDKVVCRNAESALWQLAGSRWEGLVRRCRSTLAAHWNGKPVPRWDRQAAQEIAKLADHVEALDVLRTACAVYMLQEHQPGRFRSDEAFRHQLVRRCRGLTEVNAGTWFDGAAGRVKRAYREMPPRAVLVMGDLLAEVLGPVALRIARLDREEVQRRQQEREALSAALGGLR